MEELNEEIKRRNLESSESNILSIATQVLNHMKCVEEILRYNINSGALQ